MTRRTPYLVNSLRVYISIVVRKTSEGPHRAIGKSFAGVVEMTEDVHGNDRRSEDNNCWCLRPRHDEGASNSGLVRAVTQWKHWNQL